MNIACFVNFFLEKDQSDGASSKKTIFISEFQNVLRRTITLVSLQTAPSPKLPYLRKVTI